MKENNDMSLSEISEIKRLALEEIKLTADKIGETISSLYGIKARLTELEYTLDSDPIIKCGKYKGVNLSQVPKNYILWLFSSERINNLEYKDLKERLQKRIKEEEGE